MEGYGSGGGHDGTRGCGPLPVRGARRAGHCLAIGFSAAFLFVLSGWPGWQAVPFLTSDTGQLLWLVSLWLAAGRDNL